MKLSKLEARKFGRFRYADPNDLESLDEYAEWLEALLHEPCSIWEKEDGTLILLEIRQLVAKVNGLKIEVYSNEHPPPHFHVKSPNVDASFTIEGCELLNGNVSSGDYKKVQYWHQSSKSYLIEIWNSTRPSGCVVGEYKGT